MTRISVAVADCHHAHRHVFRTHPVTAVTDGLALAARVDGDEFAHKCHDRFKTELSGARANQRRNAIEHDARPHPFEMAGRPIHDARRICQAAFHIEILGHLLELTDLVRRRRVETVVGRGKMRHHPHAPRRHAHLEALDYPRQSLRREAEPVHTCVDFDPDVDRLDLAGVFQIPKLTVVMHDRGQLITHQGRKFFGVKETLQQADRLFDASIAQLRTVLDARHTKGASVVQDFGRPHQPVTVAIGLDHGHDIRGRCVTAHPREIVAQGIRIDQCACRSHEFMISPVETG